MDVEEFRKDENKFALKACRKREFRAQGSKPVRQLDQAAGVHDVRN
jgi:hypothetical protein